MTTLEKEELRALYERDGFYICPAPIVPEDIVERAVRGMDDVMNGVYETGTAPEESSWRPGDDPLKLCKIEMPQRANRAIMELISHREIGKTASAITGAEMVQVWWVQLLVKPPSDPAGAVTANVGWHQDLQYWDVWEEGSELFTAWVALSDVSAVSGPMRFIAGSHRWGLQSEGDFWRQEEDACDYGLKAPAGEDWREVPAVLPPGGASFHHCLTLHGSGPNLSTSPRRSLALHLRTEKSRPRDGLRKGLARHIDEGDICPTIYVK